MGFIHPEGVLRHVEIGCTFFLFIILFTVGLILSFRTYVCTEVFEMPPLSHWGGNCDQLLLLQVHMMVSIWFLQCLNFILRRTATC